MDAPRRAAPIASTVQALLAALLLPAAASGAGLHSRAAGRTEAYQFDYGHHGGNWRAGQCGSRERQSPIDFGYNAPWQSLASYPFYFSYEKIEGRLRVQNDGHSIAIDLSNMGFGGITYDSEQYHIHSAVFHMRSEHTFRGKAYPMELHLVHKSNNGEHGLVVAVPFEISDPNQQAYIYVGAGVCPDGYYAGWVPADAENLTTCAQRCTLEPYCQFFSLAPGRSCSRFQTGPCSYRPWGGNMYTTYQKAPPRYVYAFFGRGRCDWGFYKEETVKALWDCQELCNSEKDCEFISWVETTGLCIRFNHFSGGCSPRPNGLLDHVTYKRLQPGSNLALEALIGGQPLPEAGKQVLQTIVEPEDLLRQFIDGGTYFEYQGSLTVPPCTEDVTWFVRREPLVMSCDQADHLKSMIYKTTADAGNWRALMPLMGRNISIRHPVPGPAPVPGTPGQPTTTGAPVQVDLAAHDTAKEALAWAAQSASLAGHIASSVAANVPAVLAGAGNQSAPPISALSLAHPVRRVGGPGAAGAAAVGEVHSSLRVVEAAMEAEVSRSLRFAGSAQGALSAGAGTGEGVRLAGA